MVNALGEKQRRAMEEGHSHLVEEVAGLQRNPAPGGAEQADLG